MEAHMWLKAYASAAVMLLATGVYGHNPAAAADPPSQVQSARVGGGEVIEFGGFQCMAKKSDGEKLVWACPAQSFASKFKEAPVVFFSIAGFDHILVNDGGLSLGIDTKDDISKDGFQPIVDEQAGKPTVSVKSMISITWIAIGEGERGQRPRRTREERLKLREMRQQEKAKGQ
jgi:hypothetical protein